MLRYLPICLNQFYWKKTSLSTSRSFKIKYPKVLPAKTNRKDMPNNLSLPCLFINVIIHSAIRAIKAIKHTIPHTIENGYAIGYIE